jgi:hypothetical protein
MDIKPPPLRVVTAERTGGGVLIEFDNGDTAIYPASLLASIFSQAIELEETDFDQT